MPEVRLIQILLINYGRHAMHIFIHEVLAFISPLMEAER
jgi:hypothetical protein